MLYGKQSRLNVKEAVWHVQQDRRGFEWNQTKWWPRCDEWGRRGLATQEILDMKEVRITRVVGQPYQDASNCLWGPKEYWTNPRGLQHSRISMLLRSVYDLLPTPVNLKWKVADSSSQCSQCGTHGTLEHILSRSKGNCCCSAEAIQGSNPGHWGPRDPVFSIRRKTSTNYQE